MHYGQHYTHYLYMYENGTLCAIPHTLQVWGIVYIMQGLPDPLSDKRFDSTLSFLLINAAKGSLWYEKQL